MRGPWISEYQNGQRSHVVWERVNGKWVVYCKTTNADNADEIARTMNWATYGSEYPTELYAEEAV